MPDEPAAVDDNENPRAVTAGDESHEHPWLLAGDDADAPTDPVGA